MAITFLGPLFSLLEEVWKKLPITPKERREQDRISSEKQWKKFVKRYRKKREKNGK